MPSESTKVIYILLVSVFTIVYSSVESDELPTIEETTQGAKLAEIVKQIDEATNITTAAPTTVVRPRACTCGGGLCSCCSRLLYETWKQRACVNVTYDPDEFSFTANVIINDRVLYTRSVSGKNPRPICVPLPRIPALRACVRFYNIYFQGRNVHACVNMEAKFSGTTVVKVGMDCIRLGANGVAVVKPEDGGGVGQVEFLPATDDDNTDDNDYDDDDDDDDDDEDDDYY